MHEIPHTFTIDADGVLQGERIGDASIEGKLKKLVRQAEKTPAAQIPLRVTVGKAPTAATSYRV